MESFKEIIIRKMQEQDTYATEVARQIGVSRQYILDTLNNEERMFSREMKEKIASVLHFTAEEQNAYLVVPYDTYHFGILVKTERKKLGLSQNDLQKYSNVSVPIICGIEKRRIIPTKKIRVKLARVLNIPKEYIEVM